MQCLSAWKSLNRSTKREHLIKHPLGKKPTVVVTSGNKREEKPSHLPTPRRAALASETCLLHGAGHSSEECKVLKFYSEKYAAQRPHKPTKARFGGKPKCGKVVEFEDNTEEVNNVENHGDPITRKKRGTNMATIKAQDQKRKRSCGRKRTCL